jgi:hypothetical protein
LPGLWLTIPRQKKCLDTLTKAGFNAQNVAQVPLGTSKNPWFFEETIGTWMCQSKSMPQGFDFEEKRKRRFSFFVHSKNPGGFLEVP